ncbi:MAG: DUF4148 domain-containing protein [Pigmentiphaga sp.]|uniref:DUF4148 domain-containing protein n=1 Tax=Pigmentiphaga sp. TaxID=1977564 RepID=UPI0029B88082|nr:DUF4148 domain-containing protein [Pigmentiphaga sp.]MDX3905765.1 DUF4148 domain-containing protein [Pigmentiphaga sp.]
MKVFAYTALIAASMIGAAAHADAGNDYANDFPPPGISTTHELTRGQVLAELAEAKAHGGIVYGQEGFPDEPRQQSAPVSRAQVVKELKRAELAHRAGGPGEYPFNM